MENNAHFLTPLLVYAERGNAEVLHDDFIAKTQTAGRPIVWAGRPSVFAGDFPLHVGAFLLDQGLDAFGEEHDVERFFEGLSAGRSVAHSAVSRTLALFGR